MKIKKFDVPFTQIPNSIIFDPKLTWKAKALFAYIQAKPDNWEFASERMSDEALDGVDSTKAGLLELMNAGYLIRKKLGNGRMEMTLIMPEPKVENPVLGPKVENPSEGNSLRGKTPRIINKESIQRKNTKKKEGKVFEIPSWLDQDAWARWEKYRSERKSKLTPSTIEAQIKKLSKFQDVHVVAINKSIENGWLGLFPEKLTKDVVDSIKHDKVVQSKKENQMEDYPELTEEQLERNRERLREMRGTLTKKVTIKTNEK